MARVTGESKNLSGTVGNMVFYQRNGVTYVRTKPRKYRDAKTDKQLLARGRFAGCSRYYNLLEKGMLREIWKILAKGTGKNPKNLFMQHNYYTFDKDQGIIDYGRLQFSAGLLPLPDDLQMVRYNDRDCALQWKFKPQEGMGSPTDRLYVVEFNDPIRIHETSACRSEGKAVFSTFKEIVPSTHFYCFWGNDSVTSFSPTHYFKKTSLVEP